MQVDGDTAAAFLEDYGVPEAEATDTVRRLAGGGLFAARFTYRGWSHIKRAANGQDVIPGQYMIDGSEPTPDMLYEHTLDNLFEGEHTGQVDAPTGWFAKVKWPWDGQGWYLVVHDSFGFSHIVAKGQDDVDRDYAVLEGVYERWDDSDT
jgi:hypothetical protein